MKLLLTGLCCGLLLGGQITSAVARKDSPKVADLQEHNRVLQMQVDTGKVRAKRLTDAPVTPPAKPLTLLGIHSAIWCAPCHTLRDELLKSGKTVMLIPCRQAKGIPQTPWFAYSDGTADDGLKYKTGKAIVPNVVHMWEATEP